MIIALWIALIICVVWIALGEMPAGWDGHLPLPYLIALIPLLWIPTLVITVAGFALHEPALGGVAAVVCLASLLRKIAYWMENLNSPNTAQRVAEKLANNRETSRETGNEAVVESARHGRFRVMTLNCRFGRANAAAIVSASNPDPHCISTVYAGTACGKCAVSVASLPIFPLAPTPFPTITSSTV